MPNWVRNRLIIESQDFEKIIKSVVNKDNEFDFEKIIPMPQSIKITSGSITNDCVNLYMNSIRGTDEYVKNFKTLQKCKYAVKNLTDDEASKMIEKYIGDNVFFDSDKKLNNKEDVLNFGKQIISNYQKYGFADWYSWSIFNWGTKWNASETNILGDTISFETPWSCPINVITKLSSKYPDTQFILEFAEEQMSINCGSIKFQNGVIVDVITYPQESKEAYDQSFELWPEMKRYFKFDRKSKNYIYKEDFMDWGEKWNI